MTPSLKYELSPKKEFDQITYFIESIEDMAKVHIERFGFYKVEYSFSVQRSSLTFEELKQRAFELGIIKDEPKWNLKKKA